MKRILILLSFLLLPSLLFAETQLAWMNPYVAGAAACDSCTGDLLFSTHFEGTTTTDTSVTAGSPCGCSVGNTTGTINSDAVISTGQYQDGGHALYAGTSSDYFEYSNTDETLLKSTAGTIDCYVFVASYNSGVSIVLSYGDANNYVQLYMTTEGGYRQFAIIQFLGGKGGAAKTTYATGFPLNQWIHIIAKWDKTSHGGYYGYIEADGANSGTTASVGGTLGTALATVRIGTFSVAAIHYIDNIKIYSTWQ